jgi:hypothetical protein
MDTISAASSGSMGGRPIPLRLKVHLAATSSRCHRRSVFGEKPKAPQRFLGSTPESVAKNKRSRR